MLANQPVIPSIALDEAIPLGRNSSEYCLMFNLCGIRECLSFVDCGGGPSSFNVEMTNAGHKVVSVDPLYSCSSTEIASRIDATFLDIMTQVEANKQLYRWDYFHSPVELQQSRKNSMQSFLSDFDEGLKSERYVSASLPSLPFGDNSFDVALCSHLLFLYGELFSLDFHLAAIREMLRVAGEVRIFPLSDLNGRPSVYLRDVVQSLLRDGFQTKIVNVPYEFQKGVNQCLIIRKNLDLL